MKRFKIIFLMFLFVFLPTKVLASNIELEQNGIKTDYENISDALKAVVDNTEATITLKNDIALGTTLTINANKNVIIDGNNHTLTYLNNNGTWYTGQLFNIKANGILTIKNMIIDANNNYSFNDESYKSDLEGNIRVDDSNKYITVETNKPNITNHMINNAGILVVDNTTIKNFYSSGGKDIINAANGSTTTLKNATIKHCATMNSGLVINITGTTARAYIEENTIIEDNFAAGNGGIFKIYNGSILTMNNGTIKDTKAINTNGVISMTYGTNSTFILNGGLVTNNSGVVGKSNGRNAPFYVHSGSKFIMNGGTIEYNSGTSTGGLDAPGYSNADVELNGGTIQYNESKSNKNEYRSDVNIQYDYDLTLGKNMEINGNVYINGDLNNNGTINGNVTLDLTGSTTTDTINGEGSIVGDVIIKYSSNTPPVINEEINITGRQVKVEITTENVARFNYNGGMDLEGYDYNLVPINKATGKVDDIPTPTKEGHTFVNWYTDKELTKVWENIPVNEDIYLYAKWEKNEYTITWNIDGKTIVEKYKYGDNIVIPKIPDKEGYQFIGWDSNDEDMLIATKDIMFTANYQKIINPNTANEPPYLILSILLLISIAFIKVSTRKNYL